jgi:hypothetical protein
MSDMKIRVLQSRSARIIVATLGIAVAAVSAFSMIGEVRVVDILLLFFGGFAAGASLVAAITAQ